MGYFASNPLDNIRRQISALRNVSFPAAVSNHKLKLFLIVREVEIYAD
jgi:hypothetical protein